MFRAALVLLAVGLTVLECYVAGYGFLGVGAIVSFALGGFLLFFHTGGPSPTEPSIGVSLWLLVPTILALSGGGGFLLRVLGGGGLGGLSGGLGGEVGHQSRLHLGVDAGERLVGGGLVDGCLRGGLGHRGELGLGGLLFLGNQTVVRGLGGGLRFLLGGEVSFLFR